jgi:hypothetical protein
MGKIFASGPDAHSSYGFSNPLSSTKKSAQIDVIS